MTGKQWEYKEIKLLIKLYEDPDFKIKDIAGCLNTSIDSVKSQAKRLKLKKV
jgi:DNA-binding MarR family transcriptional regulator